MSDAKLKELLKTELSGISMKFGEPMARHTSLKIGGPADAFIEPKTGEDAARVMSTAHKHGINISVFGGGTNTLVRDKGIEGIVMHMGGMRGISVISEGKDRMVLRVYPGTPLGEFLSYCKSNGLSGLEGLSGIPGHVGGAIWGNAGSFENEMGDAVVSVTILNKSGMARVIGKNEIGFKYRGSALPEGDAIIEAELELKPGDPESVGAKIAECLERKKASQPLNVRSAGCVFKNPKADFAARLIDKAGCKGMTEGDIEVSRLHAGFLVNKGKGTSEDFLRLMDRVADSVRDAFGVVLEPEIKVVGGC